MLCLDERGSGGFSRNDKVFLRVDERTSSKMGNKSRPQNRSVEQLKEEEAGKVTPPCFAGNKLFCRDAYRMIPKCKREVLRFLHIVIIALDRFGRRSPIVTSFFVTHFIYLMNRCIHSQGGPLDSRPGYPSLFFIQQCSVFHGYCFVARREFKTELMEVYAA